MNTSKLTLGYEEIAEELGTTRSKLQSFVKRKQKDQPAFASPDGTIIRVKAISHVFKRATADRIKSAWNTEGPGRKK